jgi:hypothetical protein
MIFSLCDITGLVTELKAQQVGLSKYLKNF